MPTKRPALTKPNDGLISVKEALSKVLSVFSPLNAEELSIADAFGRVLAKDIASRTTQPPTPVSAMDGYAVRTVDIATVPVQLTQIGEASAGSGFVGVVGKGETVRIFTGAPIPDGADTIVIQEDTNCAGNQITMHKTSKMGKYVRPKGLDFQKGQVLLKAGTRLNSRHVALVSGMNVPWVSVRRKPRIAILSNGNELVLPGEPIGPDQIISSNNLGLIAFVGAAGGLGINLGIAKDDPNSIRDMIKGVEGADLLVTIGGASVGDYDLIKSVLLEEGLEISFSRVAMRPGKPLIFGKIYEKPILGLPGNPVSAGVTATLFLKPAIDLMLGRTYRVAAPETAKLGRNLEKNDKRQDFLRSALSLDENGELVATPFELQDSSMLALFTQADCLAVRAPLAPPAKKGERIQIIRLDLEA